MKLHILSDLHLEHSPFDFPIVNADIHILAGDIHEGNQAIEWLLKSNIKKPILYVLGNHEYYGQNYPDLVNELKQQTKDTNIHTLENESTIINGVYFLGCTLWSDFALFNDIDVAEKTFQTNQRMQDLKQITTENHELLTTSKIKNIYNESRHWLKKTLKQYQNQPCVVITHHAPSKQSLSVNKQQDPIGASFASNLENLIKQTLPRLWIHGHLHNSSNYHIGNTTVLCNPRGYADKINPNFDATFVQEL